MPARRVQRLQQCERPLLSRPPRHQLPAGTATRTATRTVTRTFTHTLPTPGASVLQAIGLAASWNTSLLWGVADVISTESVALRNWHRARNDTGGLYNAYLTCWAPVVNIARDVRWGRVAETYGEDPHLTPALAAPFVRALQGAHPHYLKAMAILAIAAGRHTGW